LPESFRLAVDAEHALDVFEHPFAYADRLELALA
jgi:hypothetical protein